jgi:hypothetical protein
MQQHMKFLGMPVIDKVSGFTGTATSINFDLYGCVQVFVNPPAVEGKDGMRLPGGHWFDTSRLEITGDTPVMEVPDFAAALKPPAGGQELRAALDRELDREMPPPRNA